jgi:hypothetical protein
MPLVSIFIVNMSGGFSRLKFLPAIRDKIHV